MFIDWASVAEGQIRRYFYRSSTQLYFFGSPFFTDSLKEKFRDSSFWKNTVELGYNVMKGTEYVVSL